MENDIKISTSRINILGLIIASIFLFFTFLVPNSWADSLGMKKTFYVDSDFDYSQRSQINTTLLRVSQKAYFYVENNWWNSLSYYKQKKAEKNLEELANEFDKIIYPRLTNFFGDAWDPGIDGDSHITILMTKLIRNAGGYFNSCNEYSHNKCDGSNEREMIHVNADYILDAKMKSFIAHEFQHLINWNQKERLTGLKEDIWLNEMRSEYVPSLLNYNEPYLNSILEARVNNFLNAPSDPMGEWTEVVADYGVIALFGHYLADQFGENIFSLISQEHSIGIKSVNQALVEAGYSENFEEIFTNWTLANYYNSLAMGRGGKYGYTNSNLKKIHISPKTSNFYSYGSISFSENVKDWSPRWYLLKNKLSSVNNSIALKIEFESSDEETDFKVPYMVNYKNGSHELGFMNNGEQNGIVYVFNFAKDVESILVVPVNHSKKSNFGKNDYSTLFNLKASTVIITQPVIASISPSDGWPSGNEIISIKGGNFQNGIKVYFGGTEAPKVDFIDETFLSVIAPPHEIGPVNVWVQNPDGKSSVFAQGYKYKKQNITDGSLIRAKNDYKVYIVRNGYKRHILDAKIFDFYGHLNWLNVVEVESRERDSYRDSFLFRAFGDTKVYEVNENKTKHWLNMTAEEFSLSGRNWNEVFVINNQERDFYKTGESVLYE